MLKKTGLSPLGPLACNTAAPDEGIMFLLGKLGTPAQKERFLKPVVAENMGTTPVREVHRFDEAPLAAWMAAHVEDYGGAAHGRAVQGRPVKPDL